MQIDLQTLRDAVRRGIINESEAIAVWEHLHTQQVPIIGERPEPVAVQPLPSPPPWRPALAALAVAVASALALLASFELYGSAGLAVSAAALTVALLAADQHRLLRRDDPLRQVLVSAAVLLAPVSVHGLVQALGQAGAVSGDRLADWVFGPWFPVLATAIAGAVLGIRSHRVPLLAAVLAIAVWLAAQDAAPVLFGDDPAWSQRALLSSLTGVVLLAAGLACDRRTPVDFAFWLYLPGLIAFVGGLTTLQAERDASLLLVAALHVGLVAASLLLERRAFAVAGALGLAAIAGHLADDQLDAKALSFALTGIAAAVIGLGLLYHLHHERLERWLAALVPAPLRRLLPPGVGAGSHG